MTQQEVKWRNFGGDLDVGLRQLDIEVKEFDTYEIKIVDGHGFKAKKYFDITINNWELDGVGDAFQRIKSNCLELSETENKLIS